MQIMILNNTLDLEQKYNTTTTTTIYSSKMRRWRLSKRGKKEKQRKSPCLSSFDIMSRDGVRRSRVQRL